MIIFVDRTVIFKNNAIYFYMTKVQKDEIKATIYQS